MDRVQRWLDVARWSPSGGNAQPWQVRVNRKKHEIELRIEISDEYRKDPSPMDVEGVASVIALGAFVRSLRYVCANDGFEVSSVEFDFKNVHWQTAVVLKMSPHGSSFSVAQMAGGYTNLEIESRRTDRLAYSASPLASEFLVDIRSLVEGFPAIRSREFNSYSETTKEDVLISLKAAERVRWRNPVLLEGLLREISFVSAKKSRKIPASQLGASKIDQALLQAMKRWPVLRAAFQTPLVEIPVRRALREFHRGSSCLMFLELSSSRSQLKQEDEFRALFELGECFQTIWLEANRRGVSLQPLGLPLVVLGLWRDPGSFSFSLADKAALERVTDEFREKFQLNLKNPVIGFRLGKTLELAPRAPRDEVSVVSLSEARLGFRGERDL